MSGKSKPGFDDSCRSGATYLDCSIDCSDRSAFGRNSLDGRGKTRSCLLVKTQQDSLRRLSSSELKKDPTRSASLSELRSSTRSSTSSNISFDKVTFRTYDGKYDSREILHI